MVLYLHKTFQKISTLVRGLNGQHKAVGILPSLSAWILLEIKIQSSEIQALNSHSGVRIKPWLSHIYENISFPFFQRNQPCSNWNFVERDMAFGVRTILAGQVKIQVLTTSSVIFHFKCYNKPLLTFQRDQPCSNCNFMERDMTFGVRTVQTWRLNFNQLKFRHWKQI